jgi:hypothetical protein
VALHLEVQVVVAELQHQEHLEQLILVVAVEEQLLQEVQDLLEVALEDQV